MDNLAGSKEADARISDELTICGINISFNEELRQREVSTNVEGRLGPFTFQRAWYYWVVSGPVPLDIAKKLYEDRVGRTDIRVAGHCACPSPEGWTKVFTKDGKEVYLDPTGKREKEWKALEAEYPNMFLEEHLFAKSFDPQTMQQFVTSYHIDTLIGLHTFVKVIQEAGLIPK
jgi:hypothetical protein